MEQIGNGQWKGQDLASIDHLPWTTAFLSMGRGAGKSRSACEYVRGYCERTPGAVVCLMGSSAATTRKTLAFGRVGLANITPPWNRPTWSVLDQSFCWRNGAKVFLFSSDAPQAPRGFEFDLAVLDEAGYFRQLATIVANVKFALRAGRHPRLIVTTTPSSSGALRALRDGPSTIIGRGSLYDNRRFLPASYVADVEASFKGTSLERAELLGDPGACDEVAGSLWRRGWLDRARVRVAPRLVRIIVGVDPSASVEREHDVAGVIVVGQAADRHLFVLEDASGESGVLSPREWAAAAISALRRHGGSHIVEESNKGGKLASELIKALDPTVPVRAIGVTLNKTLRATPIAAQFECGRIHMVGTHAALEDELCGWDPSAPGARSPGRIDALTLVCTELLRPPITHESARGLGPGRLSGGRPWR
jgi:phage terminase large subunit-like protein